MTVKNLQSYQIASRRDEIPLVLVTGFLGAGKTTLLRALIPDVIAAGCQPVVVINDYQNANVDAERLREFQIAVAPVSGSCVCCGSRDELMDLLDKIELPANALVLLEANGTTDTATLIELLTLDKRALRYSYPVQICVIDAKRWGRRLFYDFLEKSQLQTASYVFVSRQDQVKPARWQQVVEEISRSNPHARHVTPTDFAKKITSEAILKKSTLSDDTNSYERSAQRNDAGFKEQHRADVVANSHAHNRPNQKITVSKNSLKEHLTEAPHAHSEGEFDKHAHEHEVHSHDSHHFSSMEVLLPYPVKKEEIVEWLQKLPNSVFRVKGLVELDPEGWQVFELVEDLREVVFHPVKGKPNIPPRAVLIGPNLRPEEIIQLLRSSWP